MSNKITTKVLLEHMQGMKQDLLGQMKDTKQELLGQMQGIRQDLLGHMQGMKQDLQSQITGLRHEMHTGFRDMYRRLEDARLHREALQEDLIATMRTVAKHDKKLSRLKS